MPPKGKLTALEIADFETWVKMGVPDPRVDKTVVDRLFASRKFGERWGRFWLDLARAFVVSNEFVNP